MNLNNSSKFRYYLKLLSDMVLCL